MDVGAGNGILSLFSIQAGAKLVHAVEASNMASALRHLVRSAEDDDAPSNPWLRERLSVVHARVENVDGAMLQAAAPHVPGAEQVDTIVSECLGVLLVHERMCESFIEARDRFLKPGGAVFPRTGTLCFALLHDTKIWQETKARGDWWDTTSFYNVDLTPFAEAARAEAFSSPVVGCFSPTHIVGTTPDGAGIDSAVCRYQIDFSTIAMADLQEFDVPLAFDCIDEPVVVHGLGAWFDLSFLQPDDEMDVVDAIQNSMTTGPFTTATHWAQVRLVFREPLALNKGQRVLGTLHFQANANRSYDITASLHVPHDTDVATERPLYERSALWKLDRQTYSWETM